MSDDANDLRIECVQFLNFFPQRAPRMMWLLGAGASVNAGLPTAGTLIWEFKRNIYCNENRVSQSRYPNLEDRAFQTEVQSYFSSQTGTPPLWADEEYSYYFERYLYDESDRTTFLKDRLRGTHPGHGHICLASLMAISKTRVVWTTNFDTLIERGYQALQTKQPNLSEMTTVSLADTEVLTHAVTHEEWPILVKIHGDYRFKKLKNTTLELQTQDRTLRRLLVNQCRQWGLAVVGYSGRDESVMEALTAATNDPPCYPQGLYWFTRAGTKPAESVVSLLKKVRATGAPAAIVEVGGFDELMEDLFLPHQEQLPIARDLIKTTRPQRRPVEMQFGKGSGWPLIRTNALEVTDYPATCTIFGCKIGGSREVSQLTGDQRPRVTAARRKKGVIAFGTKKELLEIFKDHSPERFDVHPIVPRLFRYESHELGMFYEAICQGLANATGLQRVPGRKGRVLYFPNNYQMTDAEKTAVAKPRMFSPVTQPKPNGPFHHQGVSVSLEYRGDRLWMLLEPTIVLTSDGEAPYRSTGKSKLIKESLSGRYNGQSDQWLSFWVKFLEHRRGSPIRVTFPDDDNPEAEFKFSVQTAFSRPE